MTDEEMAKEYEEKAECVEIGKDINVIKLHDLRKNPDDLPETSGEMHAQRKPVLAYTKSLGWTQAIRRRVGKKNFEWVCSDYDGNTLFSDDEITAWTELPEPTMEEGKHEVFRNISIEENA